MILHLVSLYCQDLMLDFRSIGIGRSLAAPPSHTSRHTDHVPGRFGRFGRGNLCTPTGAPSIVSPRSVSSRKGSCPTDALPLFLNKRPLLSFNPPSAETVRAFPFNKLRVLYPLLTSPLRSTLISQRSVPPTAGSHATSQGTVEISRGKTQNFPCVDARFIKSRL